LIATVYRHIRRNLVILFVLCSILLINVLVLYLLDQKFNAVKRDKLIQDDKYDPQMRRASVIVGSIQQTQITFGEPEMRLLFAQLYPAGTVYLATPSGRQEPIAIPFREVTESLRGPVAEILGDVIEGDNIFFRAEFYPCLETTPRVTATEPTVRVEDLEKWRRANNYSNSLFTRTYENVVLYRMGHTGNVRLYYTSPTDADWMPGLLARYRFYSGLVIAFAVLTFLVMLRKVLLPLKRVATGLDAMRREEITLIDDPWAGIEVAYNSLARNTMVMHFDRRLAELATAVPETAEERFDPSKKLVRQIPPVMAEALPFGLVYLLRFDDIEQRLTVAGAGGSYDPTNIGRYFDTSEAMLKKMFEERSALLVTVHKRENIGFSLGVGPPYVLSAIICDQRYFGVLVMRGTEDAHLEEKDLPFAEAATRAVENTILKVAARRLMIDR